MSSTNFAVSGGSVNILNVRSCIREYISEKSESRGFNLDSYAVRLDGEPSRVVVELVIGPHGAEQVEPFKVTVVFGALGEKFDEAPD